MSQGSQTFAAALPLLALFVSSEALGQVAAPAASAAGAGSPLPLLEAIQQALRGHPELVAADASVEARTAEVRGARATFDPVATASLGHRHTQSPVLPSERLAMERKVVSDVSELGLGAAATTSFGMQIAPTVAITRLHQRRTPFDAMAGAPGQVPSQRGEASVTVTQPLLRGRGEVGTSSGLVAAERDREAALHARAHIAQQTVFGVIAAYWEVVATTEQVTIEEESLARAQKLLDETRLLVQGNQRPAADLVQLEGHLHNRTRAVADARRARRQALHGLRLAMGLSGEGETPEWRPTNALPRPAAMGDAGSLEAKAVKARQDLRAAGQTLDAARALLAGAERNALPALDFRLSLGFEGATDQDGLGPFASALGSNVPGLNAGASLSLELPIHNDARRAARDRTSAELKRRATERDDLERQVRIRVSSARDELRLSAEALAASEQAAAQYARAVDNEQTKLRAGLATVIDVVLTQDLLTQVRLGLVRGRLDYALALSRLRFEAGELPSNESEAAQRLPLVLDASAAGPESRP